MQIMKEAARIQRRGRPGISPEFPVMSASRTGARPTTNTRITRKPIARRADCNARAENAVALKNKRFVTR